MAKLGYLEEAGFFGALASNFLAVFAWIGP